jgi:hypothetical protein
VAERVVFLLEGEQLGEVLDEVDFAVGQSSRKRSFAFVLYDFAFLFIEQGLGTDPGSLLKLPDVDLRIVISISGRGIGVPDSRFGHAQKSLVFKQHHEGHLQGIFILGDCQKIIQIFELQAGELVSWMFLVHGLGDVEIDLELDVVQQVHSVLFGLFDRSE